jgi:hypothetical protein
LIRKKTYHTKYIPPYQTPTIHITATGKNWLNFSNLTVYNFVT